MPRIYALLGATALLALLALVPVVLAAPASHADTSGPDPSGYSWTDSSDPSPTVEFDWIDLADGTQSSVSGLDDASEAVTLPFPFIFFETEYTEVDISSNGFLSFNIGSECNDNFNWDDTHSDNAGNPIPHSDATCEGDSGWGGNPLIAGWFDDLDPKKCGNVYYDTLGDEPDRRFVVEYRDVCHAQCDDCGPGDGITFEVLLFEGSGDIKMQYLDTFFSDAEERLALQNRGLSATTGIGKDADVGLGYSWLDPLPDELAVLYTTRTLEPTPTPTPAPSATASPVPDDSQDDTAIALAASQAPAELPGTGGRPDEGVRASDVAMAAAVLVAIGLGGLWTVLRARAP